MPKVPPPYPPEFRREAVELVRISDKPISRLAKDLGVSDRFQPAMPAHRSAT